MALPADAVPVDETKSGVPTDLIPVEDMKKEEPSIFTQPEVQKRTQLDLMKQGTSIPDIQKTGLPSYTLGDFLTPSTALAKPEIMNMLSQVPASEAVSEGLQREEALFANTLREMNEGKADVVSVLKAGGKALSGEEISTFGNYLKDIGFDDFSAASAGFLMSMALPSNIFGGKALKAGEKAKPVVDTLIHDLTGTKGVVSEVSSKMTGIPKEDFEFVLSRGSKVLEGKYDTLLPKTISQRIADGLNNIKSTAGEEVTKIKNDLKLSGRTASTEQISMQMDESMKKFGFDKNRKFLSEDSSLKSDMENLNELKKKFVSQKDMSLEDLLNYRDELGEMSYSGFKRGGEKLITKPTEKADAVLRSWRKAITQQIHNIAPELKTADRKFVIASSLRERGAKFFDDVSKGERVLASLDRESLPVKDKLLIKNIVRKISGTEDWIDSIRANMARKSFSGVLPKGMLQRLVGASALGLGYLGGGGPVSAIGLSMALSSSPVAVKKLIQLSEGASGVLGSFMRTVKSASARKALQEFLKDK